MGGGFDFHFVSNNIVIAEIMKLFYIFKLFVHGLGKNNINNTFNNITFYGNNQHVVCLLRCHDIGEDLHNIYSVWVYGSLRACYMISK